MPPSVRVRPTVVRPVRQTPGLRRVSGTSRGATGTGHASSNDDRKPGLVKELVDAVVATCSFARDAGGRLYRFAETVYMADGALHVKRRVKQLVETWERTKEWSSH